MIASNSSFAAHPKLASWVWDIATDSVEASDSLYYLFGLNPAERFPNSANLYKIYTMESVRKLEIALAECFKTGEPYTLELEAIHSTGKRLFLESYGTAVRDDEKNVVRLFGQIIDRTEQYTTAEKIRLIADFTLDWESWFGPDGRFLWINPAAEHITGYSPTEIMQMPDFIAAMVAPEDREFARNTLRNALHRVDSERGTNLEVRIIRKDGSQLWLEVSWQPVFNKMGEFLGIRSSGRDISSRRKAEAEVMEQQWRISQLMEAIPDRIYFKDLQSRFLDCNNPVLSDCGLVDKSEIIGKKIEDFLVPLEAEKVDSQDREVMKNEGRLILSERWRRMRDGTRKCFSSHKAPLRDKSGKIIGLVGVSRDITEKKQRQYELELAKEKAVASTRSKTEFLAVMSHELRTPLNGIIGYSELLISDKGVSKEARDHVQIISESGRDLLRLLESILDYSRVEGGALELKSIPFSLSELAWKAIRIIEVDMHSKRIKLSVLLDENLPSTVCGDPGRLQQILLNLLRNAVKFTKQGEVSLSIKLLGKVDNLHQLLFSVQDTGIGIPDEIKEAIFLPFTQGDNTLSRIHDGVGIGLTISERLLERMGSVLRVESELGKGSRFFFELQLAKASSMLSHVTNQAPKLGKLDKSFAVRFPARILVVEDNPINLKLAVMLLGNLGYENTFTATNGDEALRALEVENISVIFMDLQMPKKDGIITTREIRSSEAMNPQQPPRMIVALSANTSPAVRIACFEAGADAYISKPFNTKSLAASLAATPESKPR